jgi:heme-degrading monooxygenase HmoA
MIARLWSARASVPQSRAYLEHFDRSIVPKLRELEGYVGATVLTRRTDREVEILVATLWQSLEAIQHFAGPDVEAAVVAAEAAVLLNEFDRRVRHFEVASTDQPEGSSVSPPKQR